MSNPLRALAWKFVKALVRRKFPDVSSVPIDKLAVWLMGDMPPPVLIDVRQREEYEVSHLPNALHLPTLEVIQKADIPANAMLVLYCSVGYRSALVAHQLQVNGYKNVMNLEGSIFEWYNRGHPVVVDGRPVKQVHPYSRIWGMLLEGCTG
ncbi:MAG: rhodanese-like domain-containing protein [Halioglobus sp.]|jgi:rhodanese-related sulfurtransferase